MKILLFALISLNLIADMAGRIQLRRFWDDQAKYGSEKEIKWKFL